ncbi:hypothetical protein FOZ63_003191, partial [Perkinsus olseni]
LEKLRRDEESSADGKYRPRLTAAIEELDGLILGAEVARRDLEESFTAEISEVEHRVEERKKRRERELENKRCLFEFDLKLFTAQEKMYSQWQGGKYKKGPLKGILRSVVGYVNDINALTVDISCRNALATLQYRARMLQARLEKEVGKDRPEEEVNVLADSETETATVIAKREKFERRMLADSAEVAASLESWQASLEEELSHRLSSIYEDVKERVMVPIQTKPAAVEKIVSACGVSRTELECRLARTAALEQAVDELTVSATSLNARMVWNKHIQSALESTKDTVGNLVELVNSIGRMSPEASIIPQLQAEDLYDRCTRGFAKICA